MAREGLYMLAIMPPPDLTGEIEEIRQQFADTYQCKAALKPPVHITLIPPFKTADIIEDLLIRDLEHWASSRQAFSLELRNFDVFRRNQVVFIHVVAGAQLKEFQKQLEEKFRHDYSYLNIKTYADYNPHITIGYRDIPRASFNAAAEEYLAKAFSANFPVDKFYLWKHNAIRWQILHAFSIKQE